jgi:hypothetical protein
MDLSEERKHVVFAQAIELNVSDEHHVFVRLLENRIAENVLDLQLIPAREPLHRFGDALWGLE